MRWIAALLLLMPQDAPGWKPLADRPVRHRNVRIKELP